MRILFVTPYPPAPLRIRPYQFARTLRAAGHTLTLATPISGPREAVDAGQLAADGFDVISAALGRPRQLASLAGVLPSRVPLQARYAWQPHLAAMLVEHARAAERAGEPYVVAHVEHLRGAKYGLALRGVVPVVWDAVDSIADLFEQTAAHTRSLKGRLVARVDGGRTRGYEGRLARRFGEVVVTAETDRTALAAAAAEVPHLAGEPGDAPRITVVPNGVDLDYFQPAVVPRLPATLVFSGKLSYHANVTAARHLVEDVMPLVWAERPDAQVVLAGAEPSREVSALAVAHPDQVTVTGRVPDLRPYLHRSTVAVAPMVYGVGIQNKVLEAMATATPVVASPIAVRALSAQPGRDVLVGADSPSFARHVLDLLSDPARALAIGQAGRLYVEREHRWSAAVDRLEGVYEAAVRRFEAQGAQGARYPR